MTKTFIEVKPDFLHPRFTPKWNLYRFDKLNDRYYVEGVEDGLDKFAYLSITSLARKRIPMGYNFHQWLMNKGQDAMREKMEKATFGTLFHREAMKPLHGKDEIHGKGYNFSFLDDIVDGHFYFDNEGSRRKCTQFHMMVPPEFRHKADSWRYSFKRGLVSWFHFVRSRVIDIIAVEFPARCRKRMVAGTIDFVHSARFGGSVKACITDIKSFLFSEGSSSSKTFYPAHQFQLELCKDIWNEAYGDTFEVTHVFNWSPKAWQKDPADWKGGYEPWTWKNQTDNPYSKISSYFGKDMKVADMECAIAIAMGEINPPSYVKDISGSFENVLSFNPKDHATTFEI